MAAFGVGANKEFGAFNRVVVSLFSMVLNG